MTIAGRYEPTGSTSAGGMGEVIECTDVHLKRRVIVKRLQVGVAERRLLDEQKALAKLRSKHVVQLYDIVELTDRGQRERAIVIEYIDGQNLPVGSYRPSTLYLKVLWQIACGLRDIHAAGVIHRDIKPANIRLDTEGVIKIIDFGLARSRTEARTRGAVGTPIYMAPELWGHNTVSFDQAIDVYAFGVTAVALLTTSVPPGLSSQPPRELSLQSLISILAGMPADIVAAIHACLRNDSTARPSMNDVQNIIARRLLENEHRALVVMNGQLHSLDRNNKGINLKLGAIGSLSIEYDGFDFIVVSASGEVLLNNSPATTGTKVPGCCVITFGTGSNRRFVTFDVSHPEVMP
jgi:serine/threonine protein kinase